MWAKQKLSDEFGREERGGEESLLEEKRAGKVVVVHR